MKSQAAGKRGAIIFLALGLIFAISLVGVVIIAGIVFLIIRFFNPIV